MRGTSARGKVGMEQRVYMAARRVWATALMAIGLLLAGCEQQARPEATTEPPIPPVVPTVIGDRGALPPACQPEEVARLVMRFFDAVNRGDLAQIDQIFAISAGPDGRKPQGWYSVDYSPPGQVPRQFAAFTQSDLLAYFRERHAQRERLRLVGLQVRGPTWHGGVDITYTLARSADDLTGKERPYGGKGAINCSRQQLFVWSMTDIDQPPLPGAIGAADGIRSPNIQR